MGCKSVYFTNQSPCFTVIIENTSEKIITGTILVYLSFDQSGEPYEKVETRSIDIDLDSGESKEFSYELDMLSYQGSAAISIDTFRLRDKSGELKIDTMKSRYRMYTFVVYDREYYKVNYLTPRRSQYLSAIFLIAVGVVGIML